LLDIFEDESNDLRNRSDLPPLSDAEEQAASRLPSLEAARLYWNRFQSNHNSEISRLFSSQILERRTCLNKACRAVTLTSNISTIICISIFDQSVPGNDSLEAGIAREFQPKVISENKCDTCKQVGKRVDSCFTHFPRYFIFNFSRFRFNQRTRATGKNDKLVEFPEHLDLTRFFPNEPGNTSKSREDTPPFKYECYAVCQQIGTLDGGHYTACIKNRLTKQWHNFNDSTIQPTTFQRTQDNRAYMVFYRREG
jgi:ubiquitin carboxyl-terminal hydrolase 8